MEENYVVETNNIIALCHIIDDFEEFEKKLIPMISPKYNRDFVFQLLDVSTGKFVLGAWKAKKFYNENKSIIDKINKYSNIAVFINNSYDRYGKPNGNLRYLYQYIFSHKNEISKICALLEKIKELGFSHFKFNDLLDFTGKAYNINSLGNTYRLTYVANIKPIPNYRNDIKYETTYSNYRIDLNIQHGEICEYGRNLVLNSLLFDLNSLPKKLDNESIVEYILNLNKTQKDQSDAIRTSVYLNVSVSDLENQLRIIKDMINRLNDVDTKEQLSEVLLNLKENIGKLKNLSLQYDNNLSKQEPLITSKILEEEKKLYLQRREWSNIDIC